MMDNIQEENSEQNDISDSPEQAVSEVPAPVPGAETLALRVEPKPKSIYKGGSYLLNYLLCGVTII